MESTIQAIQNTSIPHLLIITGLLFLLLGFVKKLGGLIEVSSEFKKWTIPIGLVVLVIGLILSFIPSLSTPKTDPGSSHSLSGYRQSDEVKAVINDPDGYTNIRSGHGTEYSIIYRIVEGEIFYTIPQNGNWWPVRTENNMTGYIHKSRIKLINNSR